MKATGMTYIRAQKAQIDAWEAIGNPGWNWDALLPYYKKAEGFILPISAQGRRRCLIRPNATRRRRPCLCWLPSSTHQRRFLPCGPRHMGSSRVVAQHRPQ
jgi:choline dehydrogenase-like flavoprotein